ncbi:MAG: MotA/TolQ/ExbB proton channel family protein [Acidobacteria bacterium]|nr:MotA/TolQ/ExbB proton channel family protein [Acidobacteriota bacterium]
MPSFPQSPAIHAAMRASRRAASAEHAALRRGLDHLATIASLAPLLGLLITLDGIVGSFIGCGGEKSFCMAAVVERLSNAMVRCAAGLLVGLISLVLYRYLLIEWQSLRCDMENATLELANTLQRLQKGTA